MKHLIVLGQLVKRSLKIFMKDKAGVFFSMLAPLIILMLYIFFLGDLQLDFLKETLANVPIDNKLLKAFVDGWMLAGVIAVSCLTVSFSAQSVMVRDREDGVLADTLVSPIKRFILTIGYLISNYIITILICLIVATVSLIYLAFSGWYLSVSEVFGILGMLLLSAASACFISTLVCKFLKTTNTHGALVGILSAMLGFVIGAYMPISMFPKPVQYFTLLIPGSYSSGVFRNLYMQGALAEIRAVSPQAAEAFITEYSLKMDFFGKTINMNMQLLIFVLSIVIVAAAYVIYEVVRKKAFVPKRLTKKALKN